MASWITIYLQDTLENLDIKDIQQGIADADWWTLGEQFDLEDDDVDDFMDNLEWKNKPLEIGQTGNRPVQIHVWKNAARINQEIDQLSDNKLPETVREHLKNIHTIIAIELGSSHLETMHEILAFEIAYWLAETKRGLISSPDDLWYDHGKNRWQAIL